MPTTSRMVLPLKKAATSSWANAGELARSAATAINTFFIDAFPSLELILQRCRGLLAGNDRHDLEADEIGPFDDPALKQRDVVAFHQLKATAEIGADPAVVEFQALRHETALLVETLVDRLGVLVAEFLDHHEQHGKLPLKSKRALCRSAFLARLEWQLHRLLAARRQVQCLGQHQPVVRLGGGRRLRRPG